MDPLTIGAIATTLIKSGPDIIRGIGSFFGDDGAKTADKVAGLVDIATGRPNPQQSLEQAMSNLSPKELLQLEQLARDCEAELARIEANRQTTLHQQTQQTIRAGDASPDEYVRNTRPKIARQSWYFTAAYCLVMSVLAVFDKGDGPSIDIAMLLISGAWTYMGLRTLDGFAPHPKGSGQKMGSAIAGLLGRR
ncbi:hypothetical protein [Shewanella algae]|uniref:hypothetical protein n=1 Tax=Shewanella algae TaxID=38313 RepID=UPI0031F4F0AF